MDAEKPGAQNPGTSSRAARGTGAVTPRSAPAGALSSFDDWYAVEHPRVAATLVVVTGDRDLAADAVDEGFARALERWDQVRAMTSPGGWVTTVALNYARRTARRRTLERRLLRGQPAPVPVPAPADETWQVVATLSPRQRAVVVLRHVCDMPDAEIAAVLGVARGTVSRTLADAYARLARLLADGDPATHPHTHPRTHPRTEPHPDPRTDPHPDPTTVPTTTPGLRAGHTSEVS